MSNRKVFPRKRIARNRRLAPRRSRLLSAWMLIAIATAGSAHAQRNLKEIPDPDPELQRSGFQLAEGFEINLFAADPRIAKPIQMNFDPAGRLWIASSEVYPQIEPGQTANDKILVLEDQDHDGVADSTTVFAQGLLIPTGVIPGDGGAYVANSTELLHFRDTDGDGVADQERVVLSGFGTEDTHHILHTLRWGPDGLLYMNQSIYIHSHIETPYGVRRMNGGGVWHFRPETMELETYNLGLVNPWGHAMDAFGQSFETDGAGGEGINYVFPDFVGVASPGAKRVLRGMNPGKPKLCGLEIVGGSHLPDDWQGDLIANDFRAHRVCRYKVEPDGAGYRSKELGELVKTRHQAFRPIDVKLGPDGAIYIADWYNPIIQHGEVDFRDPRRDHTHGRIWRVSAKKRPRLPHRDFYKASTSELIEGLKSAEPYVRQQTRRVLKERESVDVIPALATVRGFQGRDRLELLWAYQSQNQVNLKLLDELLESGDHRIRAAATRVLYHWRERVPGFMNRLRKLAADEHPQVRMEASHVLRRSQDPQAIVVALQAVDQPMDRFLEFALQQTADMTRQYWLPALSEGKVDFGDNSAGLFFALQAAGTADAVPILLASENSWRNDPIATRKAMELVAARGNPDQMARVFERAISTNTSDKVRQSLLQALVAAARSRRVKPKADLGKIVELLWSPRDGIKAPAIELVGLWKLEEHTDMLSAFASTREYALPVRYAAVRAMAELKDKAGLKMLLGRTNWNPEISIAAIDGYASLDLPEAANLAASELSYLKPSHSPGNLIKAFLSRDKGDEVLTSALEASSEKIVPDVAKLCIRAARTSGRDVSPLVAALQKRGGMSGESPKLTEQQRADLLANVATKGNAANGEAIYRRAELNCQKCHGIGGAGGKVGPDLASIGASAPADYILESMLEPSAKIKENYHSLIVETDQGKVITGVKLRETSDSLILRDAEDREMIIPLDSIDEKSDGGSLMPAGLLNELTQQEMYDLIRFLTELGKIGDYALPREPYVRTWQTLQAGADLSSRSEANIVTSGKLSWTNVFSRVAGDLPRAELPRHRPRNSTANVSIVRFPIEMSSPGTRTLRLDRTRGLRVYLDGKLLTTRPQSQLELDGGTHFVTLVIDDTLDKSPIRASIE